jgi:hypothetical protein
LSNRLTRQYHPNHAPKPTSEFRRFYESFSDRIPLALAICVNGDWNDPEIADLVRSAATAPSVEGSMLQCLIGVDEETDPTSASSTPQQGVVPSSAAPSPSTSYNPFHPKAASQTDPASSPCTHAHGDLNLLVVDRAFIPSTATAVAPAVAMRTTNCGG